MLLGLRCHSKSHTLHRISYAAIYEARQLIYRIVGTAPSGVRVQRVGDAQMVPRARHCDIHQAPLLIGLLRRTETPGGREPSIDSPDEKYRIPFLALRGVSGAEHEAVIVFTSARACEILCR